MSSSYPKKLWRWIKYFLIFLGSAVFLCAATIAVVLMTYNDDDYRRLAIFGVEVLTDYTMRVEGPFRFKMSANPSLSAESIFFTSEEGQQSPPPIRNIGKIKAQISLLPLFTGTLVFKEFKVDDADLEFTIAGPSDRDNATNDRPFLPRDIDLPVFESVHLGNIQLEIIDTAADRMFNIRLRKLILDDVKNTGPMFVNGEGTINKHEFDINGRMGALVSML